MARVTGFDPARSGFEPVDLQGNKVPVGVWGDSNIGLGVFGTGGSPPPGSKLPPDPLYNYVLQTAGVYGSGGVLNQNVAGEEPIPVPGVVGISPTGTGVVGYASYDGFPVSPTMVGVVGLSVNQSFYEPVNSQGTPTPVGVWGDSPLGVGVFGSSGFIPDGSITYIQGGGDQGQSAGVYGQGGQLPDGLGNEVPVPGVIGVCHGPGGTGVSGTGELAGVEAGSQNGFGLYAYTNATSPDIAVVVGDCGGAGMGVQGTAQTADGVQGHSNSGFGVHGISDSGTAVHGLSQFGNGTEGVTFLGTYGVSGLAFVGDGVYGSSAVGNGVEGYTSSRLGYAGLFVGNVNVTGTLHKAGGGFRVDHPVDPEKKYLSHSFVESPDMMNVYSGTVTTDDHGNARVALPDYFEALNRDFRYQLTAVGQFAQLMVSQEINRNEFAIRSDSPHVKVCWQVTGVRQDAWAQAHRIPVEQDKPAGEKGRFLHPELFGHKEGVHDSGRRAAAALTASLPEHLRPRAEQLLSALQASGAAESPQLTELLSEARDWMAQRASEQRQRANQIRERLRPGTSQQDQS